MTCKSCNQERYIFDRETFACFDCWRQNKINILVNQSLDSKTSARIVDEICEHITKNGDEINAHLDKKESGYELVIEKK